MKNSFRLSPMLAAILGLFFLPAQAEVTMPAIFGDHMVLQQESKLPVWGTAAPGEKVTVSVGMEQAVASAGSDGKWRASLPPLRETALPVTLTVKGTNTLTFQDVLIGDVWLCSGQSNMEWQLQRADHGLEAVAQAADPQLRLFVVASSAKLEPQTELSGTWQLCSPQSVPKFSAIGYFYGRELRRTLHRPIGLIQSVWGVHLPSPGPACPACKKMRN